MAKASAVGEDFSLVLGGPLYQLFLRSRLAREPLLLVKRRIVFFTLLCWLPPAVLSLFSGEFLYGARIPFLLDIGTHVRFLFVVPLLIVAEMTMHERIRPMIGHFFTRNIVPDEERPKFDAILQSITRLRNSVPAEVILILVVYTLGQFIMRSAGLQTDTWYRNSDSGTSRLTVPGYWYAYVSIPVMQFLIFRWYYRLALWIAFLARVAKLKLRLIPTHPDGVGGLGFLTGSAHALTALILAHGGLLAGSIASRILFDGKVLSDFKFEILGVAILPFALVFGPLCCFTPLLLKTRRQGLQEYGAFASQVVRDFEDKWLRNKSADPAEILDKGDVQSLADLGNSFEFIRSMKPVPFNRQAVMQLVFAFALPLAPLVLTVIPADEIFSRLIKLVL